MIKIRNFFRRVNIRSVLGMFIDLYLLCIILSNLYFVTQAGSYFVAGKYALSTILALLVAILIAKSKSIDS